MSGKRIIWWIGLGVLVIGLLLVFMIGTELYDGRLYGSRSAGITRAGTPLGYYVSVALQSFIAAMLSYIGIALLWADKKK